MGSALVALVAAPLALPWLVKAVQQIRPTTMAEEIIIPTRFLTTVSHLIAVLTLLFDLDNVATRALSLGHSKDTFDSARSRLLGLSAASLIFFGIEFVGTFAGVSLFLPAVNGFYIFTHFAGAVLVGLFVAQHWAITVYGYLFTFCSLIPATLEMLVAFALFKLKLMEYS